MIIELENIILREYKESDWERVHLYASIAEFSQFDAWGPNSVEDTKTFISQMLQVQKNLPRYQFEFAIEDKSSGNLIGGCGLRRETQSSNVGNIGYAVNPDFQGKGVATEATKGLLELAFKELKLIVVYATCDSENIASFKVMEKSGMKRVGLSIGKRKFKNKVRDELRFEIIRDAFNSKN